MTDTSPNMPDDACDCHVHIYELERYPLGFART
jgi:D-galactarolactone isomerase